MSAPAVKTRVSVVRLLSGLLGSMALALYAVEGMGADATAAPEMAMPALVQDIPARRYVNRTVTIPGGHYDAPYVISTPGVEYLVTGDIVAEGTAIAIRAAKVVLNLNGKSITYNQSRPGEGVTIDAYNKTDIAIINGKIFQGAALSEGDEYGRGNNPIRSVGMSRLQVANIHARYGGRDVTGFKLQYVEDSLIEGNLLEDDWSSGTLKNRHQGIDAIQAVAPRNIVRNNIIRHARHRGISIGSYGAVYGNSISLHSLATNSAGIGGYRQKHVTVHDNRIVGRGEHPIGIGFVSNGTDDIDVYHNSIDVQTTMLGTEYGSSPGCLNPATPCGNYAVGFRTTWGGNNIRFHDNSITVHTDASYHGTQSANGKPVLVNGKGRGLMVALNAGESARFYNNRITVLDKDGKGTAFGIACNGGNAGALTFADNTVITNNVNVVLGDEYGACGGYPLFVHNTFVKKDSYPGYSTVACAMGGYFDGTGRFVSNRYLMGASKESVALHAAGKGAKSVFFGREIGVQLQELRFATPSGVAIRLANGNPVVDGESVTGPDGATSLLLYDYELHNRKAPLEQVRLLSPHRIQVVTDAGTFVTKPDSSATAWDALAAAGIITVPLYRDDQGTWPVGYLTVSY